MKFSIKKVFIIALGLAGLGFFIGVTTIIYFSFTLPKISTLGDYRPPIPSKILAKDGTILAEVGIENRDVVSINEVPQRIIDAFLSAEDAGFFEHSGVDYLGLARAMLANLKAGRVVQGGSTITQQVAKSLLLTRERSISRKIKDFLLARKIEERFNKKEILHLYLNQVYLGGGYYGIKAAFNGYFNKTLEEATVAEAAMIAGLLVAPGKYSPYNNPNRAKTRQGYVLGRMYSNGKITEEQYQKALKEKVVYQLRRKNPFKAGYFTDWVRQRVIEVVGSDQFLRDGYTVQTTLDWELQQVAEREVEKGVRAIDKRQGFKGPLSKIESFDNFYEELKKKREKFYKDQSSFFVLNDQYEKQYEFVIDENEVENIQNQREDFDEKMGRIDRFQAGYNDKEKILPFLETFKDYKATVLKVDDWARIVYVDVLGVTGIIPYSGFNWAHERKISEERNFYPYITKPSTILQKGDVVNISIKSKKASLERFINKSFKTFFDKVATEKLKLIKKQNYLLCILEQVPDAQGALVSIDPKTGEIISMVGGWNFQKSQFNRAIQSNRQPGSSFKPLLFAAGLENGYNPASIIIDSPEALGGFDETVSWKPRNYDGKFKGPITYRESLEQSRNVPTIKIAEKMGVSTILDFAKRIGFNAKIDEDLSMALGSFGVTLLDIVTTYGIFPNGGRLIDAKSILTVKDRDGAQFKIEENKRVKQRIEEEIAKQEKEALEKSLVEDLPEADAPPADPIVEKKNPFLEGLGGEQVYDERLAYLMTYLLRGIIQNGTGRGARHLSNFIGGKTGTTNNYVDAWFLGFSSNVVLGVWTGFDDNKTLGWGETGAKSALPVWKGYMASALKKYGEQDFRVPQGIINVKIDKSTGKLANRNQSAFVEAFVEGTEPGAEPNETFSKESESTDQVYEDDDFFNK